ncbi:hypothetical protein Pmani_002192 [Petrolisthes manimaculis]|uniref:Secreted protein n=1 Tax=Petrolisthes manimaculis TaxID=1843537 RepID=A0AAE1UR97_9EUCA|nr:hypothetical protein Pmani_002192 [Petrolisthes manimaculis]
MKTHVLMLLVLSVACGSCWGVWLETFHDVGGDEWKVPEDTIHTLTFSLRFKFHRPHTHRSMVTEEAILEVTVVPDEEWKLDWVNRSVQFTGQEAMDEVNKSLRSLVLLGTNTSLFLPHQRRPPSWYQLYLTQR